MAIDDDMEFDQLSYVRQNGFISDDEFVRRARGLRRTEYEIAQELKRPRAAKRA